VTDQPGIPPTPFRLRVLEELRERLRASAEAYPEGERLALDLHCHDRNSDRPDELWGRMLRLPETWLEPRRLQKILRARGTTAWTVTNHNNARSCWELLEAGKDVLTGAEWTVHFPEYDLAIHVLVHGFSREEEAELDRLRIDVYAFLRYCRERDLPVTQPHPLYFYARGGQLPVEIFEKFAVLFERFEVCNGQRDAWQNLLAWQWVASLTPDRIDAYARKHGLDPFDTCVDPYVKAVAGGSDDHFGVFAGLTGTWLHVPDLGPRLAGGEAPSCLALEALRAKRMAPFGQPGTHVNLSVAFLDFLAQAAEHFQDPGLIRLLLHKGEASDKIWCVGIANGLEELRRHKYTLRFLRAWHDALQGEKPGWLLRFTVKQDYLPFLDRLQGISKVARKTPEALPSTLQGAVPDMFRGMVRLMLRRAGKRLGPMVERWEAKGGPHRLRFDDWVEHFEIPTHFRLLLGLEKLKEPQSMSRLQVTGLLDDLTFPTLMAALVATATGLASRTLHGNRELLRTLAAECGGTPHPERVLWLTDTLFDANGVSGSLQSVLEEARTRNLPLDLLVCHPTRTSSDHLHVVRPLGTFQVPGIGEQSFNIPDLMEVLDLVQTHGYDRLVVSTEGVMGWVGLFLKHALKVKANFFVHTDWLEFLNHNSSLDAQGLDRVRRALRWFYQRWDGLFVLNRQHRAWLAGPSMEVPGERLHLTAHWAAADYVPDPEPPAGGPPVLLFAGRLSEEKGVLEVVQAWQTIRERVPGAQLVFAGQGPAEARLRKLVPEARFLGWVDRPTLAAQYRASTLLLFPSRFDTFGCAVLEALSCGLPVACYPVKGPADLVQDGVNGLLCENAEDLGRRAVDFLTAPEARRAAFRKEAVRLASHFQARDILDRLLQDLA
jgi:glycosyltransferase involved in cell wall biosynthesis